MGAAFFLLLAEVGFFKIFSAFDNTVYKFISAYISDSMTVLIKSITFWGSATAFISICSILLIVNLFYKNKRFFIISLITVVNLSAGSLLNYMLKELFRRPRPLLQKLIDVGGYSFPSGHSMISAIFYGFLIYISIKYIKHWLKYVIAVILSFLILTIGISRVYLGVHYASDVLGGFIIGSGWLILFVRFSKRIL